MSDELIKSDKEREEIRLLIVKKKCENVPLTEEELNIAAKYFPLQSIHNMMYHIRPVTGCHTHEYTPKNKTLDCVCTCNAACTDKI